MEEDSSELVVRCQDHWQRRVIARLDRWNSHILDRHPELGQAYDAVETTIREPDLVTHDASFPNGENFYRRGVLAGPYRRHYLKVSVAFGGRHPLPEDADGAVVTAYVTRKLGKGERQRWPEASTP